METTKFNVQVLKKNKQQKIHKKCLSELNSEKLLKIKEREREREKNPNL